MNLSDFFKTKIIDHMLRNQSYTPPATLYLALFTVAPTSAGGGTEVSGGAYARQALVFTAQTIPGVTENTVYITFPVPTTNWGTITHAALFDASSAGNLFLFGSLVSARVVNSGGLFKVLAGDLDFSLT